MKKTTVKLSALHLKKEIIADLAAAKVWAGAPFTQTCIQTGACTPTCTLDGTKASANVSNCCPHG